MGPGVGDQLRKFVAGRQAAVKNFETSLIFIGEAINPEAPKAAKAPTPPSSAPVVDGGGN